MNSIFLLATLAQAGAATSSGSLARPEVVFVSDDPQAGRLHLDELLGAVDRNYPPLAAARKKIEAAEGSLMSSRGAFDLKVKGKGGYDPLGFYDTANADIGLEQLTPLWGLRLFAGYRWGNDDFPIYGAKSVTGEAGEARAGFVLPLWRDGPIDADRLAIRLAELGVDVASLDVEVKRLEAYAKASSSYFKWLAAGRKLAIDRGMLTLAEDRRGFVELRVEQGALPRIERVDNERLVVSRKADVARREGELQRAALNVSLFLRDPGGQVVRPELSSMPTSFPPVDAPSQTELDAAVARGLERRPEMARIGRAADGLAQELRFFENQRAPAVDLTVAASKDFGDKASYGPDPAFETKGETELGLSLSLSWPVEQRKARGKAAAIRAKLEQVELERRFLADAIEVQIRDAFAQLLAAFQRAEYALEAFELTRQLEAAERRRLELGQTNIFLVNLREESTAKAAKEVVDALMDYHSARAVLAVAAGDRPR